MIRTTVELTYSDGRTAIWEGWDWARAALGCGDPLEPAVHVSVVAGPRGEGQ